jgi:peptide/nickel transport system substrate-binding protein
MTSIQDLMAEDAPLVPLFQSFEWAVSKPNVDGVVLDVSMIFRYYLVFAEEQ